VVAQRFFGDASYAIIGPYLAEIWPNRLRGSGMGFGYGIGNLGKIIGPLALAVIVGSSNYVSPKVTLDAIFPAFLFLSYWYAQAALAFLLLGIETKGRSIEDIGRMLDGGSDYNARGQVAGTSAPGLLR
jgi:MFS transporter, putative metabolite:H+ symporter